MAFWHRRARLARGLAGTILAFFIAATPILQANNRTCLKEERPVMGTSLISVRRFSHPLRLRLQVLFAKAFEALADTYRAQATEFVRRLRGRMTVEDALDRYFREVGVPHAMEVTVRARALIALAPTAREFPEPDTRAHGGWTQLRPEQLIDALRRRAHSQEETNFDCRMAASVSDEAIAGTHVAMALETVALLEEEMSPDDAIMHYVRHFDLPSVEAQIIFRRTLAAWSERHPIREPAGSSVCASTPTLSFVPRVRLGLRVAG
jgi:hypothetical protein